MSVRSMHVLHVVPTFYPATFYGGPIFSLYHLCNQLATDHPIRLTVLTTDSSGPTRCDRLSREEQRQAKSFGYDVHYCWKTGPGLFSPALIRTLLVMMPRVDLVHLTGVYSFPTLPTLLLSRILRKPLVWSPRGALQRWAGSTKVGLKNLWDTICTRLVSPNSCVLHVTSREEAEESHSRISRASIELIENGVDIPANVQNRAWTPGDRLRLLYIGRLHPKKGIENLLRALKLLDENVSLTVCGSSELEYASTIREQGTRLGLDGRVKFLGHVSGRDKSLAFMNADICVVPSFTENFAMVVAEALAHGVPVIASRGTPWQRLVDQECGLWVDNDPVSLAKAISAMRHCDLPLMGDNGRRWMAKEFSWSAVANKMYVLYRRLLSQSRQVP